MFTIMHINLCSFAYMFLNKLPVRIQAFSRFEINQVHDEYDFVYSALKVKSNMHILMLAR